MRTLLSVVGVAAYEDADTFVNECATLKSVMRPLQNAGVAKSCATAIDGDNLALYLARQRSAAPCRKCRASFTCYRCNGTARKHGRECAYCVEGVCTEGTGGDVIYKTAQGRVITEPFKSLSWRARQPALLHQWEALAGPRSLHACAACKGTGVALDCDVFAIMIPTRVEAIVGDYARAPSWATPIYASDAAAETPRGGVRGSARRRVGSFWLVADRLPSGSLAWRASAQAVAGDMEVTPQGPLWVIDQGRPVYSGPRFRGVREWEVLNGGRGLAGAAGQSDRAGAPPST